MVHSTGGSTFPDNKHAVYSDSLGKIILDTLIGGVGNDSGEMVVN